MAAFDCIPKISSAFEMSVATVFSASQIAAAHPAASCEVFNLK
jgi:hypothetical protein